MKRVYVIMRATYPEYDELQEIEPVNVVSDMTTADTICGESEKSDSDHMYYWREVISDEE